MPTAFQQAIEAYEMFEVAEKGRVLTFGRGPNRHSVSLTPKRERLLISAGYMPTVWDGKEVYCLAPSRLEELLSLASRVGLIAKEPRQGRIPPDAADRLTNIYDELRILANEERLAQKS